MCFHFFDQWSITHLDICCRNLHCRLSVCVSVCVCVSHRCLRSCARSLERFRSWGQTSEQKQLFTLHHVEIFSPPRNIEHTLGPRAELFHFGCGSPWPPFMWDDGSPKYPLKAHAIQDPTNLQYKSCIAVGQAIITLFSQVELEIVFGFKQDFFLAQIWLQNLLKNQPILAKKEAKTHLIQE